MGVFARRLLTTSARAAARTPALTFPQRRLPDGTRISGAHARARARSHAVCASRHGVSAAPRRRRQCILPPATDATRPAVPARAARARAALPPAPHATPAAAAHAAAAGPVAFIPSVAASPYVGRNSAAAQPPRTTLSKKEMELIEARACPPPGPRPARPRYSCQLLRRRVVTCGATFRRPRLAAPTPAAARRPPHLPRAPAVRPPRQRFSPPLCSLPLAAGRCRAVRRDSQEEEQLIRHRCGGELRGHVALGAGSFAATRGPAAGPASGGAAAVAAPPPLSQAPDSPSVFLVHAPVRASDAPTANRTRPATSLPLGWRR